MGWGLRARAGVGLGLGPRVRVRVGGRREHLDLLVAAKEGGGGLAVRAIAAGVAHRELAMRMKQMPLHALATHDVGVVRVRRGPEAVLRVVQPQRVAAHALVHAVEQPLVDAHVKEHLVTG